MSDEKPSTLTPISNSKHRNIPEERRCVGHKKTGERCQRPSILGATVCRHHGGAAPHVKRAAKARIENASDRLARQLLAMAEDESVKPETRLAAIKDALDRAGLNPRQAMDVQHSLKKYEQVLEGIDRDSLGPDAPSFIEGEFTDFGDGRSA